MANLIQSIWDGGQILILAKYVLILLKPGMISDPWLLILDLP